MGSSLGLNLVWCVFSGQWPESFIVVSGAALASETKKRERQEIFARRTIMDKRDFFTTAAARTEPFFFGWQWDGQIDNWKAHN